MFGLLSGKARNVYLNIRTPKYGCISFRKVTARPKMKLSFKEKEIIFTITVNTKGYLIETTENKTRFTRNDFKRIENLTASYLTREMIRTVDHLQRVNSDILGLGERFRAAFPEQWVSRSWNKTYPEVKIRVNSKFAITRTGTML
jgi:hypothetical protein